MSDSALPYLDYSYHNSTIAERSAYFRVEDAGDERTIIEMLLPPSLIRCNDEGLLFSETEKLLERNPSQGKSKRERAHANGGFRSEENLRRTMRRMQNLLCANFEGKEKTWFLTLTFAEQIYDFEEARHLLSGFWRRLKRSLGQNIAAHYLCVPEPHENGAWHLHLVIFFEVEMPEPSTGEIEACWRLGSVDARRVYDVYGLACYLNPLSSKGKRTMNGASTKYDRIGFYPANKQIVLHSKGMEKSTVRFYLAEKCKAADLLEGYDSRTEYPLRSADGRVVGTCIRATKRKSR